MTYPIKKITASVMIMTVMLMMQACSENEQATSSIQIESVVQQQIEKETPEIDRQPGDPLPTISSASEEDSQDDNRFRKISWDELLPEEFQPAAVLMKYQDQLEELDDDDPKAMALYGQIQSELDNAPINELLDGKPVKIAGFIAPLENTDGKVSEFLLVPYYGACIHVPAPPLNQTVLVKTTKGSALDSDKVFDPVWVSGFISTKGLSTDIGTAGYRIMDAQIEIYDE